MVNTKLRLVTVVGLGARPEHDSRVVDQDVDVHVLGEDGASEILNGTEILLDLEACIIHSVTGEVAYSDTGYSVTI